MQEPSRATSAGRAPAPVAPGGSGRRDPGLDGVVPFRFQCHRCGHCCSGGTGHVWLEDGETERMARALGMEEEAFVRLYVRRIPDPATGALRLALRERTAHGADSGGACALLEGAQHCTVYGARPAHCRQFPYWDSVLTEGDAFERARATCPGITVEADPAERETAFARLAELYAEVDTFVSRANPVCIQRGVCCRFEDAGHELFATALEADYAASEHPEAPPPEAPGRCPYHIAGRCTARAGRPLGCRTYFCDKGFESVLQEAHEHFLARLRAIERETGYPAAYARFPALLEARGVGGAVEPAEPPESAEPAELGSVEDSDGSHCSATEVSP